MLEYLRDGREWNVRDVSAVLAEHFKLSDTDKQQLLPSGGQKVFTNRVAWSKAHLKMAGLIDNPTRGKIRISEAGHRVLNQQPALINCRFLKQFPAYLRFIGQGNDETEEINDDEAMAVVVSTKTPQELIESAVASIRKTTADELLERLRKCSPGFFETVVVRFLQALGYGATGEALVTGKSGDGGVDGIIKEDKLGLDIVCIQAKRWKESVGRPVIQQFVGSMDGERAKKGVILTTSSFTRDATEFVDRIEGKKVVLIDGPTLANLMIEYGVGVITTRRFELKEVSNDFFEEDEG